MERDIDNAVTASLPAAENDCPPGQEADTIQLRIPGMMQYVSVIREAVDAIGEQIHLPPDDRAAVKLAVGEACNNAVLHAREHHAATAGLRGKVPSVDVLLRVAPDALEIDVMNQGNGFHPNFPAHMPEAERLEEHGRGMALMEMMMDSVEYLSVRGNTVVRMRKHRAPAAS